MRIILVSLMILLASPSYAKKGCQAGDGALKVTAGAVIGGTAAFLGTWGGAIIAAPFTGGASFVTAWYGTIPAITLGAKGGAIAGAYLEGGQCIYQYWPEGDD